MKHRSVINLLCWSPCYLAALVRVCFAQVESSPFRYHFQFFLYWNGQWMQQYFKSPLQLDQVSGVSQMDQEKRDNIDCWHCSTSGGNPQSDREDQSFQLLTQSVELAKFLTFEFIFSQDTFVNMSVREMLVDCLSLSCVDTVCLNFYFWLNLLFPEAKSCHDTKKEMN